MQHTRTHGFQGHRLSIARLAFAFLGLGLLAHVAPASAGSLDRIREAGKLTLGYRVDAPPLSYQDESGKPAGYSIALCGKVVDALKAEPGLGELAVEYVAVTSEDRFRAVKEGRIDLLCGEATATLARRRDVAFSIPIFPSGIGALLRADAPTRLREVLEGREPPYRPRWRGNVGTSGGARAPR